MEFYSRRRRSRILTLAICLFLGSFLLPYDNTIRLFFRWHWHNISHTLHSTHPLTTPGPYPLDFTDIGIIIKTGLATKDRLGTRLLVHPTPHPKNIIVVGDYSTDNPYRLGSVDIPVHNVLAEMADSVMASSPHATRLQFYWNMTASIADGDWQAAEEIGREYGWELDIMKHISGLELGYRKMPPMKWYILADDDTYLLKESLEVILRHLDPSVPHYIGNAVGDFRARFAHGGSAVILSQAAMHRIFVENPDVIAAAHLESLEARWGDKLIATTAMKTGIYLDERFDRYFNGEPPWATRIRADRFCAPIVSFHKIPPQEMEQVGSTLQYSPIPFLWIDTWRIYSSVRLDAFLTNPVRADWDHVGKLDETTMTSTEVATEFACLEICLARPSTCLAWTWDAEKKLCHVSPWMIVGQPASQHFSGINAQRAVMLAGECPL